MRRPLMIAVPLLSVSLALAGCGGGDEKKKETGGESTPSATPTPVVPILSPLTGSVVEQLPNRPVLVVKVDNVSQAAPQQGLDKADLVVEELVEGGVTRLAAFYYSKLPENVGPVRSMRTSDIHIVAPVQARIITSGAAAPTIAALKEANVQFFQEGSAKGFSRDSSRYAPHNLFANVREIGQGLAVPEEESAPYFEFGDTAANPQGQKVSSFQAHFGSRTTEWALNNGTWENTNTFQDEAAHFTPDSVVALEVKVTSAGYSGSNGSFVPESHLLGTGKAWVFDGDRVIQGVWKKDASNDTVSITKGGKKITVPAGKTYVELVPEGEGGITLTK